MASFHLNLQRHKKLAVVLVLLWMLSHCAIPPPPNVWTRNNIQLFKSFTRCIYVEKAQGHLDLWFRLEFQWFFQRSEHLVTLKLHFVHWKHLDPYWKTKKNKNKSLMMHWCFIDWQPFSHTCARFLSSASCIKSWVLLKLRHTSWTNICRSLITAVAFWILSVTPDLCCACCLKCRLPAGDWESPPETPGLCCRGRLEIFISTGVIFSDECII